MTVILQQCVNPQCCSQQLRQILSLDSHYQAGEREFTFSYHFSYCEICGLGFVNPRPSEDVLMAFYGPEYPYHQVAQGAKDYGRLKLAIASGRYRRLVRPSFRSWLAFLGARMIELASRRGISLSLGVPPALKSDAVILDFGCGGGAWLLAMRARGYTRLYGCDFFVGAERFAELTRAGVHIWSAEDLRAAEAECLDLVRLEHVFEHLLDPCAVLRELARLLRPGGWLVMTLPSIYPWLPIDSLATSPHLDHLQLPVHLTHHSLRSVTDFLTAAGLEIRDVRVITQYQYITAAAQKQVSRGKVPARRCRSSETRPTIAKESLSI